MTWNNFEERLADGLSRRPDVAWIRNGLALLGWGEAVVVDPGTGADRFDRAIRELQATESDLAIASFTFDENAPGSIVVIPQVLARIGDDGVQYLEGSAGDRPEVGQGPSMPDGRLVESGPDDWVRTMSDALDAIGRQEVEKVVLSRTVTASFDAPIPRHLVLAALAGAEPGSHTFLIDGFTGSSPELLCSLRHGVARSVSLAGSASLEDANGINPLDSGKMALEHNLAADSVDDALAPFCSQLQRSPSSVATYGEIRHLSTTFEGVAHPGTKITDLLGALHPTAAVAGTPTKAALELIRELEHHDRGRYAGPVGWLDRDGDGEFAIALRCGDIRDSTATLYAGAGVVHGSDPMLEFGETLIKLRPMLRALGLA